MEHLTRTERMIIAEYLSRNPPPRAKDLAAELGVSVKTVYKALYKYRKMMSLEGEAPTARFPNNSGVDGNRDLVEAIRSLKLSVDRLNELLSTLIKLLSKGEVTLARASAPEDLPPFVKDNPWLEIVGRLGSGEG